MIDGVEIGVFSARAVGAVVLGFRRERAAVPQPQPSESPKSSTCPKAPGVAFQASARGQSAAVFQQDWTNASNSRPAVKARSGTNTAILSLASTCKLELAFMLSNFTNAHKYKQWFQNRLTAYQRQNSTSFGSYSQCFCGNHTDLDFGSKYGLFNSSQLLRVHGHIECMH